LQDADTRGRLHKKFMEPITFATEGYMASQYIGQIKQAISQYFPAISPEDAAALAWGGLT